MAGGMRSDLARAQRKLDAVVKELDGSAMRDRLEKFGKAAADVASSAVPTDIGDQSMSHWWKSSPIDIVAESKALDDRTVEVRPPRKTRGPWRVLEEGRKGYAAGDFRVSGMRYRKRTDDWVQKRRRVKRAMGATTGKQTWTDAVVLVRNWAPGRLPRRTASDVKRIFGR